MDNFKIDSHKLNFHPRRVADWLEATDWERAKKVYPIYLEVSPSGFCNHRCIFCSLDFMGYQKKFLDADVLKKRISEMAKLGVKSIMFAGEGEPLLHKDMADIAIYTKNAGIDTAFTTNGSLLTEKFCYKALDSIEWVKVSVDAGMPKTYAKVHGVSEKQFALVLKNIANAVRIRNEKKSSCVIGSQMLLLPENIKEVVILAKKLRDTGCNYFVVKPHSQHPQSHTRQYERLIYSHDDIDALKKDLEKFDSRNFQVVIRKHTAIKLEEALKPYSKCYSAPFFWAYITASGDVYSCSMFLGDKRFLLGNIYRRSFQEIWEGEKRKRNWLMMKEFDAKSCRKNCRMDECNRFLHQLKNPPPHVNFI